ncbi:MAG TPA: hypothetical protein VJN93_06945 [Candidatus Acidoferrum sp.]|nr:hypothetical protein [Candidatus Acidoferrum sp.]
MNLKIKTGLAFCGVLLLGAVALQAQRRGFGGPPFGAPMELMGFAGMHGKTVTGAPFSATATTETTQTLQDGSMIHRTSQFTMYRDSQGRLRQEATFSGFGALAASGGPKTIVMISDPVAGVHYMLDATNKIAHESPIRRRTNNGANAGPADRFASRMQAREQQEEAAGLLKKESLGTQTMNGVVVEGTRMTRTIPAGQIGNDKPLQIVSERWYSQDLQMVMKSTHTDPRFGTTTYTVTNIQRTEPAATLFSVPSDYTVQTGGRGRRFARRGGAATTPNPPPPNED